MTPSPGDRVVVRTRQLIQLITKEAGLNSHFPAFPISPLWAEDVPIWAEDVPIWGQDVPIWGQDVPCASLVPFVPLRQRLLFYPLQPNASKGLSQTSRSFKSSQSFCAICASEGGV